MASGEDPTRNVPFQQPGRSQPGGGLDVNLDLQLSELRRALDVATTKIDGQLAVLLQKSDYAEQRAREAADHVNAEFAARDVLIKDLIVTVNQLRTRLYFLSGFSTAFGGAIGIVATFVSHK